FLPVKRKSVSGRNSCPAKSLSVGFLPPETKSCITLFLHPFRNPEREHRLNCCLKQNVLVISDSLTALSAEGSAVRRPVTWHCH
uniref:Uncharacterized protein n=1 Tax=Myotis lucifugus TaxID=59463 RepID=G1QE12_MYOLU